MTPVTRATVDGRAYLDLQNKARKGGRSTDELIQLYVLEDSCPACRPVHT